MKEIAIKNLENLQELDNFILTTNDKVELVKGLIVANDDDIKLISKDIKELKDREDTLKVAESKLIELAGIDRIGVAIANSREHRLLANKNVQVAKQKIKDDAINYFIKKATDIIEKSKASNKFKVSLPSLKEMAIRAILGKSSNFIEKMDEALELLELKLERDAILTSQKMEIINTYTNDLTRDLEQLLTLSIDEIKSELSERKAQKQAEIEQTRAEAAAKAERQKQDEIAQADDKKWVMRLSNDDLHALDEILFYLERSEKQHYEECDESQKANHIFTHVLKIQDRFKTIR